MAVSYELIGPRSRCGCDYVSATHRFDRIAIVFELGCKAIEMKGLRFPCCLKEGFVEFWIVPTDAAFGVVEKLAFQADEFRLRSG